MNNLKMFVFWITGGGSWDNRHPYLCQTCVTNDVHSMPTMASPNAVGILELRTNTNVTLWFIERIWISKMLTSEWFWYFVLSNKWIFSSRSLWPTFGKFPYFSDSFTTCWTPCVRTYCLFTFQAGTQGTKSVEKNHLSVSNNIVPLVTFCTQIYT